MKLLQKFFQWDADQGWFAKGLTLVLAAFFVWAVGYGLLLSSFGVGNYDIAKSARAVSGWWKVGGFVILLGTIYWDYVNFSDTIKFKVNELVFAVSFVSLIALIVFVNCGFRFPFA